MSNPYSSVIIRNYNLNPPTDGGEETAANEITWAKHKNKLGDPLRVAIDAIIENVDLGFSRITGSITNINDDYTVLLGDQGKVLRITADNATVTLPDPSLAGAKFQFAIVNASVENITIVPSASEDIDGGSSLTIRPLGGVVFDTDGTDWYTSGHNYEDSTLLLEPTTRAPEGYLTLTSGTPVITSDVAAATTIYYTQDAGNCVPISDGIKFRMREFTELSLSLSTNHIASALYDVFIFEDDEGTIRIATGPAWNIATAGSSSRGSGANTTEIERWKGLIVNKMDMSARNGADIYSIKARRGLYVGTIRIDQTAGQVSCHRSWGQSRRWGVWNYFNRKLIILKVGDGTVSWVTGVASFRVANGAVANNAAIVIGVRDEHVNVDYQQFAEDVSGSGGGRLVVGIGWNTGSASSGTEGWIWIPINMGEVAAAKHSQLAIGAHNIFAIERSDGSTASMSTVRGTSQHMQMSVEFNG